MSDIAKLDNKTAKMSPTEMKLAIKFLASMQDHQGEADPEVGFLWGAPGVGKSDIVYQAADEMGGAVFNLRLVQFDITDLIGIPFFGKDESGKPTLQFAPSSQLPHEDSIVDYGRFKGMTVAELPYIFLFFDEMNQAATNVQAACYQLILDRRLGQYKLPANVIVVGAGNRSTDRSVSFAMPLALRNRLIHFTLESNFDDWHKWAIKANIHPQVLAFLKQRPDLLNKFNPKSDDNAFPTPRTWEKFSNILWNAERLGTPEKLLAMLLRGAVGAVAESFILQRKMAATMPDPLKIIKGEHTDPLQTTIYCEEQKKEVSMEDTSMQQMLMIGMSYILRDMGEKAEKEEAEGNEKAVVDYHKYLDNAIAWAQDNIREDLLVVSLGMMTQAMNMEFVPHYMSKRSYGLFMKKIANFINPTQIRKPEKKEAKKVKVS